MLVGETAQKEDVELICITDTRLNDLDGLRYLATTIREVNKRTGKTWSGKIIPRKEDMRVGGALILHTAAWVGIKIREVTGVIKEKV